MGNCYIKRNVGIELFRCLLMLCICMRHATALSGRGLWWEANIFNFGVVGFALITGYFGVSFKPSKLIRLWGLVLVSVFLPAAVVALYCPSISFASVYKDNILSNWYLNAYTVILLLSPIINIGLQKISGGGVLCVIILLAWSWMSEFPLVQNFTPILPGFGGKSVFALLYAYVIGNCIRRYGVFEEWRSRTRLLVSVAMIPLMALAGANTSPFTIVFAALLLVEFSQLSIKESIGKIVIFISPSMFSVYLIHTNHGGLAILRRLIARGIDFGLTRWGSFVLASCTVFGLCLAIDLLRRALYLKSIKTRVDEFLRRIDERMSAV